MHSFMLLKIASIVLLAVGGIEASFTGLNARAIGDLCFLWSHRLTLVGNRLFFINGQYTFTGDASASPEPYLYSVDLSSKLQVEQPIAQSALQKYSTPAGWPSDLYGGLWSTNDKIFVTANSSSNIASFDTKTNTWHSVTVAGSTVNLNAGVSVQSVSAPSSSLGFAFGWAGAPGLVTFNASNPDIPSWSNDTGGTSPTTQVPNVLESEMVYLPMGKAGVVLMFGGYTAVSAASPQMLDMSMISVYDIDSKSWYTVKATGGTPGNRGSFCSGVSASPDNSSYQVTIFGGWDPSSQSDREDVWILTVPSFRWINVGIAHDDFEVIAASNIGRAHHRCATYNDAQVIVVGGSARYGTALPQNETSCKSEVSAIRVLDTTTYSWKQTFDPDVKYQVPDIVWKVIGGDATGNANITEPEGGWNYTALQTIFALPKRGSNSSSTSSGSSGTSSTNGGPSSGSPAKSKTPVGTIVGGVIAGVIVFALLAGLLYFILARRRREAASSEFSSLAAKEIPSYTNPEPPRELASPPIELPTEQEKRLTHELPSGDYGAMEMGLGTYNEYRDTKVDPESHSPVVSEVVETPRFSQTTLQEHRVSQMDSPRFSR